MNGLAASAAPPSPPPQTASPKSVVAAASSPRYSAAAAASSFLFQQAAALAAAAQHRKQMQILSRHMVLAAKGAAPPNAANVADSYYDYRDDEASLPPALAPKDPDPQLLNAFFTSALAAASTLKQCGPGGQGAAAGLSPLQAIANMPYPPTSRNAQNHILAGGGQDRNGGPEFHHHAHPHHRFNYHYHPHSTTSPITHHPPHPSSRAPALLVPPLAPNGGGGVAVGKLLKNGRSSKLPPVAAPNSLVRPIAKPHPHHHRAPTGLATPNNVSAPSPTTKAPVNIAPKPPAPPSSSASLGIKPASSVTLTTTPTTAISPSLSKSSCALEYSQLQSSKPPPPKPLPLSVSSVDVVVSQPATTSASPFVIEKMIDTNVVSTPAASTFSSPTPVAIVTTKSSKRPDSDQKGPARKRSLEGGSSSPSPKLTCKKKAVELAVSINSPLPVTTTTTAFASVTTLSKTTEPDVKDPIEVTTIRSAETKSDDRDKSVCQGNGPVVKVKAKKKSVTKQPPAYPLTSTVPPTSSSKSEDSKLVVSQTSAPSTISASSSSATVVSLPKSSTITTNANLVRVITTTPAKINSQPVQASTLAPPTHTSTPVSATKISKATPLSTPKRSNQTDSSTALSNNATTEFSAPRQGSNHHHKAATVHNAKQIKSTALNLNGAAAGNSIGRYKTVTPALTGSNLSSAPQQHPAPAPQQFLFYSPATNQFYSGLANPPLNNNTNTPNHNPVGGFNGFYGGLQAMLPPAGGSNPNVIGYATAGPTSALTSGGGCNGGAGPNINGTGAVSYLIFNPNPHHNHQAQALPSTPFFHQANGLTFQTAPPQQPTMATAQFKSPGIGSLLNLASLQVGPTQPGSSYQAPGHQIIQHPLFYQANSAPSQPCILPALANASSHCGSGQSRSQDPDPKLVYGQKRALVAQPDAAKIIDASLNVGGGGLLSTKTSPKIDNKTTYHPESTALGDEGCQNDTEGALGPPDPQPRDILIHVLDGHLIRESSQPLPLPTPPFRLRFMAKHGFKAVSPSSPTSSPHDAVDEGKSNKRSPNQTSVITQGPAFKKAKSNEPHILQEFDDFKNALTDLPATVADVTIKSEDGMPKSLIEHRATTKPSLSPTTSSHYASVIQVVPPSSYSTPFTSASANTIIEAPSTPPYNSSQLGHVASFASPKQPLASPTPSIDAENQSFSSLPSALFPNGSEALSNLPPTAKDIQRWTVSDVHTFISNLSGCREHAETFKTNEIDGPALLLLKEDHLTSALKIKLGPALKIHAKVAEIRANQSI